MDGEQKDLHQKPLPKPGVMRISTTMYPYVSNIIFIEIHWTLNT